MTLIELIECQLDRPLRMLLDIRHDGVPTLRVSPTYVSCVSFTQRPKRTQDDERIRADPAWAAAGGPRSIRCVHDGTRGAPTPSR